MDEFENIFICFEEEFLKNFQEKHKITPYKFDLADTFVKIIQTELILNFIHLLNLIPIIREKLTGHLLI